MKQTLRSALLMGVMGVLLIAMIDLDNLLNYANQPIPSYITKDNMPVTNPITDEGATLGRVLFYDKNLSTDNATSCASCHKQEFAFGDTDQLSEGSNGLTIRHSMRLVNIRFAEDTLFRWDRTAPTLEAQMTGPIKDFDEMGFSGTGGAPSFADLIGKLSAIDYYPRLFHAAFGDTVITEERMQKALAQFVRSIQSFDSKYDIGRAQVGSDTVPFPNFSNQENSGKDLFMKNFTYVVDTLIDSTGMGPSANYEEYVVSRRTGGGFNCASCHRPPEFDIDPASLNNGIITGNPAHGIAYDIAVTRSPTLRDLIQYDNTVNGGMFHSGEAPGFAFINAHYEFIPPDTNNTNLDPRLMPGGYPQFLGMTPKGMSEPEVTSLAAFIRTLAGNDVYTNEKWSNPFDENGQLTVIGGTLTTSIERAEPSFQVYPNPCIDQVLVSGNLKQHQLELFNASGQLLQTVHLHGELQTVDVSSLAVGMYLLRFTDLKTGVSKVEKILKR
ncbi:cytochrome c peroxidase [Pontibacter sp. G13]|uniref:cytochrome c peroxidase n=1 Tax=Pontibacter sp. G13 TaxID=3074898 RepID=UPI002889941A|nr:cytochrome c peroxidase [Pontibacter sp. G13]WNJ18281.1 cytochrome c peroxidase [Pontibacter sp. G13]